MNSRSDIIISDGLKLNRENRYKEAIQCFGMQKNAKAKEDNSKITLDCINSVRLFCNHEKQN